MQILQPPQVSHADHILLHAQDMLPHGSRNLACLPVRAALQHFIVTLQYRERRPQFMGKSSIQLLPVLDLPPHFRKIGGKRGTHDLKRLTQLPQLIRSPIFHPNILVVLRDFFRSRFQLPEGLFQFFAV